MRDIKWRMAAPCKPHTVVETCLRYLNSLLTGPSLLGKVVNPSKPVPCREA
jgi:hypothetical protein